MKVPLCEKSKDVIEPVMKPQWWMRMKDLASEAIKVVKDGKIKVRIIPSLFPALWSSGDFF